VTGVPARTAARGRCLRVAILVATCGAAALLTTLTAAPAPAQENLLSALEDPHPLRAAETSSPRATLRSFIRDFNVGVRDWRGGKPLPRVTRSLLRAAETLDVSELPAFRREATLGVWMALLKEILDRVVLPPYDLIPGDEAVADGSITRWVLPDTKITIARIEEGPRAGEFLFSKETVANLREYYELARDLPYKKGATVGIYDEFCYSAGSWLPRSFVDWLPGWATRIVWGQGIWQWTAFVGIYVLGVSILFGLYRAGTRWDQQHASNSAAKRFGVPVALLLAVALAEFAYRFAEMAIGLSEGPLAFVSYSVLVIQVGGLSWFALVIAGRLADGFANAHGEPDARRLANAALLRIVFRLASVILLAYLGIYAVEAVGIPIAPLIAGLGVGGLALALAVRPTLENVIGGLTLFADKPVRVGDFCRYGDQIGTVEQIGLRSTRIRSLERTLVTIPNAEFAQMQLDNFQARDRRLLKTILQLRYETTPEQLRWVLAELRRMLLGHPTVSPDPARVRFVAFGAHSLDLEVFAYIRTSDHNTFLAIQEDILLRMADIVKESGTGFAFPSQTLYYRRDEGFDAERGQRAEQQVEQWRQGDQLPFPEFDPGLRWEMEDILDYPPRGAHDHKHRQGVSEETMPESSDAESSPKSEPDTPLSSGSATAPSGESKKGRTWLGLGFGTRRR